MSDDLHFVLQARRDKLDALRAAGVNPFGSLQGTAGSFCAKSRTGAMDAPTISPVGVRLGPSDRLRNNRFPDKCIDEPVWVPGTIPTLPLAG